MQMSHTTVNDSDDGTMSKDCINSPSIDEGCSGGSGGAGVLKKGPWTSAEDAILVDHVKKYGEGNWNAVQRHSGLLRCGKSCRLRWANHLRPNLKKGAFTSEEERLIIELHAKMGNKWARMASHLPGRTDNEIKNYWNTRVKRLHRAGLPLYPPDICFPVQSDGQQSQNVSELSGSDARKNDLLQTNSFDIPDVVFDFDRYKACQGPLSYPAAFPDISVSGVLTQALGSSQNYNIMPPTGHQTKRPSESGALFPGFLGRVANGLSSFDPLQISSCKKIRRPFGLGLPYDPYPNCKNPAPFSGSITGSHALLNGNFSTSKPLSKALKLELPSLQYPETDSSSWATCPSPHLETIDCYIQSPARQVQSDCPSPWNSGLLEEVIHGPRPKNQSCEKSLNSSVTPAAVIDNSTLEFRETAWGNYGDPISPLGCSASSVFSECTRISGGSPDEVAPVKALHDGDKEVSTQLDKHMEFLRPDALLASDCLEQNSYYAKDLAALLNEDFCCDYKHSASGTSTFSEGWELGSCPWNNLPAVRQMSEHP